MDHIYELSYLMAEVKLVGDICINKERKEGDEGFPEGK